ncbi:Zn-dependent hydrolase [Evansella sp. AB-P1]|uniref:Zn-dependent hydrolase n=1 Tax=Evansella sp. AB-P1 TaxID=3037653 RepID=UPI00241DB509|nr:Zn-dependent hydrolase [Evansella sp. AB-P1]MDG5790144.1 Zn-dependent hydrolase [Evansella sp. AB-P1]
MKEIKMESKEFNRVLHNLHLENLSLSPDMQKRVLELVNAKVEITPTLIKDILQNGKIKRKRQ